jgi:hypothetical protein
MLWKLMDFARWKIDAKFDLYLLYVLWCSINVSDEKVHSRWVDTRVFHTKWLANNP